MSDKESTGLLIEKALDDAYHVASEHVQQESRKNPFFMDNLSNEFIESLEDLSLKSGKATTGFTNVITGLSAKAAYGDSVDIRYHQVGIQKERGISERFSFRTISEKIVFPWLYEHRFNYAKSGWQTRTFERPKPYTLDYAENIGDNIKHSFLTCYDKIETHKEDAKLALAYLICRQIQMCNSRKVPINVPKSDDIVRLADCFNSHFDYRYDDPKGSSRLPVLAFFSIYSVMVKEMGRYAGKLLRPLEEHSAADARTGSIGDIEVVNEDGSVFEALEIKHKIPIDMAVIESVKGKIENTYVKRYYVLTTHKNHDPDLKIQKEIEKVRIESGCQLIVNGAIPSIKYYLRLLSNPSEVLPIYSRLLNDDHVITSDHIEAWNDIVKDW